MHHFFIAASDSIRPLFLSFQNPFTALLSSQRASDDGQKDRLATATSLWRMASDVESSQPSLAAELRYYASKS